MTFVFTQSFEAIRLCHSLLIFASWCGLVLPYVVVVLLQSARCWSDKLLLIYIMIDRCDMTRSYRPVLNYLMHLVDGVDHSMGHHSTQLGSVWPSMR